MKRSKFTLVLQILIAATFGHVISLAIAFPVFAMAQTSGGPSDSVPYSNPNLGFSLEYPANWQKQESLSFVSPSVGLVGAPEAISVLTEAVPTSNYSIDDYTEAAMSQIESLPGFRLINSSSTTLGGFPAHLAEFTFTGQNQSATQNLQVWTVNDGLAYIVTYTAVPSEFDRSMPVMQSMLDTFRIQE